jgi:hypothetical protein
VKKILSVSLLFVLLLLTVACGSSDETVTDNLVRGSGNVGSGVQQQIAPVDTDPTVYAGSATQVNPLPSQPVVQPVVPVIVPVYQVDLSDPEVGGGGANSTQPITGNPYGNDQEAGGYAPDSEAGGGSPIDCCKDPQPQSKGTGGGFDVVSAESAAADLVTNYGVTPVEGGVLLPNGNFVPYIPAVAGMIEHDYATAEELAVVSNPENAGPYIGDNGIEQDWGAIASTCLPNGGRIHLVNGMLTCV